MNLGIFCVYDSKGLRYGSPMFVPSKGEAIRGFSDVANDGKSVISNHPSDFVLYLVGEFDDQTGVVSAYSPLVNLGNASEFKKPVVSGVPVDLKALAEAGGVSVDGKN